jgi:hypothetical protein
MKQEDLQPPLLTQDDKTFLKTHPSNYLILISNGISFRGFDLSRVNVASYYHPMKLIYLVFMDLEDTSRAKFIFYRDVKALLNDVELINNQGG